MMNSLSLSFLEQNMPARRLGDDIEFSSVSTDSRSIQSGDLFVALRGPNFDGHEYIAAAIQGGAKGLVVECEIANSFPQLIVPDGRKALGEIAGLWRKIHPIPVIAVTGSNGKTTVKELLSSILARTGDVLATQGNLNNDIGVPKTLLGLTERHQFAVVEFGSNSPGEIEYLTSVTSPEVAVVTNAGAAHLEGFGSIDGVANEKGSIFSSLEEFGVAVINTDDPYAALWRNLAGSRRIITFGIKSGADFSVEEDSWKPVFRDGIYLSKFSIQTPVGTFPTEIRLPGKHNVMNALAAAAAAFAVGIDSIDIVAGLQSARPVLGRLNIHELASGTVLIDDTYNANPSSLDAGLALLSDFTLEACLVLGDMAELGVDAVALHREAGRTAKKYGVKKLYTIGDLAKTAAEDFEDESRHFSDIDSLGDAIISGLKNKLAILVKGSRRMRLDLLVAKILDYENLGRAWPNGA